MKEKTFHCFEFLEMRKKNKMFFLIFSKEMPHKEFLIMCTNRK